ncbi:hypothetical protein MA16_Dca018695 [Dendrobium catenatum]|uniref:Uncharacterized protein n=1 Tax=Dendrobium catenatum TaxID=906689 RepID=A0A2I0X1H3_9ASPA|nr:hypothetical protein MA16_Dca018695 [Dendrobium catenatum]
MQGPHSMLPSAKAALILQRFHRADARCYNPRSFVCCGHGRFSLRMVKKEKRYEKKMTVLSFFACFVFLDDGRREWVGLTYKSLKFWKEKVTENNNWQKVAAGFDSWRLVPITRD